MGGEQLKVGYADGSSRIVNLSPAFFTGSPVYSSLLKKTVVIGPVEKAEQLAEVLGRRPVSVILTQGGSEVYRNEQEVNQYGEKRVEKVTRAKLKEIKGAVKKLFGIKLDSLKALGELDLGLTA